MLQIRQDLTVFDSAHTSTEISEEKKKKLIYLSIYELKKERLLLKTKLINNNNNNKIEFESNKSLEIRNHLNFKINYLKHMTSWKCKYSIVAAQASSKL